MATVMKIRPADHGRPMSLDEFEKGDYEEGFQYELIDGRLYVSPKPNAPHGEVELWIFLKLVDYWRARPEVIKRVHPNARVFVPDRPEATVPEPDIAAYRDWPRGRPIKDVQWQDVSPILVVEVVSEDDPDKDLVRNVDLYLQVPTIKEYWAIDARQDPDQPTMRVYRRWGKRWKVIDLAYGETYTTRLLPGFELTIDPRS
ncbi:MAG: Uma2 family endonuclease [Gemmataceae bacterium]|nr:Uma2 family endonuclease [Gemmataceae bacterium]